MLAVPQGRRSHEQHAAAVTTSPVTSHEVGQSGPEGANVSHEMTITGLRRNLI